MSKTFSPSRFRMALLGAHVFSCVGVCTYACVQTFPVHIYSSPQRKVMKEVLDSPLVALAVHALQTGST